MTRPHDQHDAHNGQHQDQGQIVLQIGLPDRIGPGLTHARAHRNQRHMELAQGGHPMDRIDRPWPHAQQLFGLSGTQDLVNLGDDPIGATERFFGGATRRAEPFELYVQLGAPCRDFFRFACAFLGGWSQRVDLIAQRLQSVVIGAQLCVKLRPPIDDFCPQG